MGQARGRLPRARWRVGIVDVGVAEGAVGKGKREDQRCGWEGTGRVTAVSKWGKL